ncbi:MAG: AI-2E family transporter [Thermomicrobiales bacterium]
MVLALERVLWVIAYPLALVFAGVVIAQGFAPLVAWLTRFVPRPVAAVGLYLALLAGVAGAVWLLLPAVFVQGNEIVARLPVFETGLRQPIARWSPVNVDDMVMATRGLVAQFTSILLQLPGLVLSTLTTLALVFFLSLYWLIAQPSLRGWVLSVIPEDRRELARVVMEETGATVGGYARGVLLSALSIALLTYGGLLLIGVPSPLMLAIIAGIGELIPVLGPFLAAGPAIAVAFATDPARVPMVIIFYVVLQQVESNMVLPLIMRGQAKIPPLLSLIAFLIGAAVGGVVGAIVAVPLFGALRVLVVRLLVPAQRELVGVSAAEAARVRREETAREPGAETDS